MIDIEETLLRNSSIGEYEEACRGTLLIVASRPPRSRKQWMRTIKATEQACQAPRTARINRRGKFEILFPRISAGDSVPSSLTDPAGYFKSL